MSTRDLDLWRTLRDAGLVEGDAPPASTETPWYLQVLLGVSAWIAALCLFGFFAVLLADLFSEKSTLVVLGVLICAGAVAILRLADGDFFRQIAVPCSLVGQVLIGIGLFDDTRQAIGSWVGLVIVAGILYAAGPSRLHRFLCGVMFVVGLCGVCAERHFAGIVIALPILAWGAVLLWVLDDDERYTPAAWAAGLGALVVAGFGGDNALWSLSQGDAVRWIANIASAALLPAYALRLASGAGAGQSRAVQLLLVGSLVFAVLWLPAPGVAVGLAFVLAGIATDRVTVIGLGLAGAVLHVGRYYFQLDVTLLEKSVLLVLSGLLVLGLRQVALSLEKRA